MTDAPPTPETGTPTPAPAPPPLWPAFVVFGVALAGIVGWSVIVVVVATVWHMVTHDSAVEAAAEFVISSPAVMIASIAMNPVIAVVVVAIAARLEKARLRERLWLFADRTGALDIVLATVGLLAVGQTLDSIATLTGVMKFSAALGRLAPVVREMPLLLFLVLLFFASFGAGIGEEFLCRGYLQTRFFERWGRWPAILAASTLFGILHMDPVHAVLAFGMGAWLGWVTIHTRTLLPAIAAHILNNLISFGLIRWAPELTTPAQLVFLVVSPLVAAGVVFAFVRRRRPTP